MKIIHLNDKAKEIVAKLQGGFNGVYVTSRYYPPCTEEEVTRPNSTEMTKAEYKIYTRDLAYFTAEPDFFSLTHGNIDNDNDYVETSINKDQFYADLLAYIRKEVGPDIVINFREGCAEFELIREKKEK